MGLQACSEAITQSSSKNAVAVSVAQFVKNFAIQQFGTGLRVEKSSMVYSTRAKTFGNVS